MFWRYWSDALLSTLQEKHVIVTGAAEGLGKKKKKYLTLDYPYSKTKQLSNQFFDDIIDVFNATGEQFAYFLSANQVSHLVIADRTTDLLVQVSKRCIELGCQNVKHITFDAGNEQECSFLITESVKFFPDGTIDMLILNHAESVFEHIDFNAPPTETIATLCRVTQVNYFGYAALAHHALPYMTNDLTTTIVSSESPLTITVTTTRKTNIIVVSSLASLLSVQRTHVYAASKSAINQYFIRLRDELRFQGLAKNCRITICILGPIGTQNFYRTVRNPKLLSQAADPKATVVTIVTRSLYGDDWVYYPRFVGYATWLAGFVPEFMSRLANRLYS
ncbi:12112_t:CDS:1 [Ambispora leptoticha]|uniref:12112_t:CDS:1 n=1 Tax=Ambispora leptoticha TaxID=144679 RepID=A0A9N8Z801_9GLOM|nr:12112_t:CDS:1 [Ambispora leptoticha]